MGFQSSQSYHILFVLSQPHLVLLLIYVDDIIVTDHCSTACTAVITHLSAQFRVKDLGDLHYFLGLEVQRSSLADSLIIPNKS